MTDKTPKTATELFAFLDGLGIKHSTKTACAGVHGGRIGVAAR
jgi:hypothetical protein